MPYGVRRVFQKKQIGKNLPRSEKIEVLVLQHVPVEAGLIVIMEEPVKSFIKVVDDGGSADCAMPRRRISYKIRISRFDDRTEILFMSFHRASHKHMVAPWMDA